MDGQWSVTRYIVLGLSPPTKKNECHQITEKLFVWCKKRKTIIIWSPVNSDWVADSQC